MNSRSIILVSLAANVLFAGAFVYLHRQAQGDIPSPPLPVAVVAPQPIDVAEAVESVGDTNTSEMVTVPFQWAMLDPGDIRAFVENLRAAGCPENVVRDLVVSMLDQQYEPKLRYQQVRFEPWAGGDRREAVYRAGREQMTSVNREKDELIVEVLGYEWNNDLSRMWSRELTFQVALGFLTEEKARKTVTLITTRFRQLEIDTMFSRSRIIADEDVEQIKRFRAQLSREAGTLLTSGELDELETRAQLGLFFSDQIHLDGMHATGAELRTIAHTSRSYRDFITLMLTSRGRFDEDHERDSGYGEFEAALLARLGPARFAAFQRAQDEDFRDALEYIKRVELAESAAVRLYETRRDAEAQQREISFDQTLTDEERKAALGVLETVTSASAATVLGRHYTDYSASDGEWIRRLSGPATVPPVNREGNR